MKANPAVNVHPAVKVANGEVGDPDPSDRDQASDRNHVGRAKALGGCGPGLGGAPATVRWGYRFALATATLPPASLREQPGVAGAVEPLPPQAENISLHD